MSVEAILLILLLLILVAFIIATIFLVYIPINRAKVSVEQTLANVNTAAITAQTTSNQVKAFVTQASPILPVIPTITKAVKNTQDFIEVANNDPQTAVKQIIQTLGPYLLVGKVEVCKIDSSLPFCSPSNASTPAQSPTNVYPVSRPRSFLEGTTYIR